MNTFSNKRSWGKKFFDAFRGIVIALKEGGSFWVHVPTSIGVLAIAMLVQLDGLHWCLLLLCISTVLGAELFNSSVESLARAVTGQHNEHIKNALDIASGAVLCSVMFAIIVGLLILGPPLFGLLFE